MKKKSNRRKVIDVNISPYSSAAIQYAEKYFAKIRKMKTDIARIARNTKFTFDQIQIAKSYIFNSKREIPELHQSRPIDPSFEVAETWRRLIAGKGYIQPHDILFLRMVLFEFFMFAQSIPQNLARYNAAFIYDYQTACRKYYKKLMARRKKAAARK